MKKQDIDIFRFKKFFIFLKLILNWSYLSGIKQDFQEVITVKSQKSLVEELFEGYRDKVFGFFMDFLNKRELARDLTQDIFVRLLQREDRLHEIEDLDGYIYQMCKNLAFNHLKKAAHNQKYREYILSGETDMASLSNPIERRIDADHYGFLLHESLNKLPEQQRLVFSMSKEEGLSQKEIASKLGISTHTVRNHLYQAIRNLKAELSRSGIDLMLSFVLALLFL